jgi:hypothetical protein
MRRDEWAGRRRADPIGDGSPGARSTFSGGWGRFGRGREVPRRSSRWRLRFNPLSSEAPWSSSKGVMMRLKSAALTALALVGMAAVISGFAETARANSSKCSFTVVVLSGSDLIQENAVNDGCHGDCDPATEECKEGKLWLIPDEHVRVKCFCGDNPIPPGFCHAIVDIYYGDNDTATLQCTGACATGTCLPVVSPVYYDPVVGDDVQSLYCECQ